MTATPTRPRRPLVYATHRARLAAGKLLPEGVVLEVEVANAIVEGRVRAGDAGFVFCDRFGVVATIVRRPARVRAGGSKQWLVTRLEPNRNNRNDSTIASSMRRAAGAVASKTGAAFGAEVGVPGPADSRPGCLGDTHTTTKEEADGIAYEVT